LVNERRCIKRTTVSRHTVESKVQGRKAPSTIEGNIKYHCVPSVKLLGRSHVSLKTKFDVEFSGGAGRHLVLTFRYAVGSAHSLPKAENRCKDQVVDIFGVVEVKIHVLIQLGPRQMWSGNGQPHLVRSNVLKNDIHPRFQRGVGWDALVA